MEEQEVKIDIMLAMFSLTSQRRIHQLVEEGIVLKSSRGLFLLLESTQRYVAYLKSGGKQAEADAEHEAQKSKLTIARKKLANESARKLKIANDLMEKKVISKPEIDDILGQVAKQSVSILEALPLNIKRRVPALKARDIEYVKLEIAKIRNIISELKI